MYQSYSDRELIKTILAGDTDALYYLVIIKYRKELSAVIDRKSIKTLNKGTNIYLEYWLCKFYEHMLIPTKIKKRSKFESIENKDNIQCWLCQCCCNFLINDEEFKTFTVYSFDFNSLDMSKNLICISGHSQSRMRKFILTIETFNKILTNREKYVVFTYLYCEKKQTDTLLHLDKKIAAILNTSEGNIRKIKSVAYDKVRKFLNK
jgi:hypothetical protein